MRSARGRVSGARCPVCGAADFACDDSTGVRFLVRDYAQARWRSARRVSLRVRPGVLALEYRVGDPVDVVEAVRQGLVDLRELSEGDRRHFAEVARRKARRLGIEDDGSGVSRLVRQVFEAYVDEPAPEVAGE